MKTYYHFTGNELRDGRPLPPLGVWLKHDGDVVLCQQGLHASKDAFDALQYATGELLHRVNLRGDLIHSTDKSVGRERRILATIDATDVLRRFARTVALDVAHLWDPLQVVIDSKRAAAWDAARDAATAKYRAIFNAMIDAEFDRGKQWQ